MSVVVRPLGPRDRTALDTLLRAGGDADAWLRDSHARGGLQGFIGAFDGELLVGVVLLRRGALCAANLTTSDAARAIAPAVQERTPWYSIVGPERPCSILAHELLGLAAPRVDRVQVFMTIREADVRVPDDPGTRIATEQDVDALVPLVTEYRLEDGLSGADRDPAEWVRAHVRDRVEQGLIHLVERDGRVVFTGAFNFLGSEGAGLGGIYTVPDARGHGIAARATATLCRRGLRSAPVVTLHVDETNAAARRCYENVGFAARGRYRLTFR